MEYPFRIAYQHEQAVDTGGVARDMFSEFLTVLRSEAAWAMDSL